MSLIKTDLQKALKEIKALYETAVLQINSASNIDSIEEQKVIYLGRKSKLTSILKELKNYSPEDRKILGNEANQTKIKITELIESRYSQLLKAQYSVITKEDQVDVTVPVYKPSKGHIHPVTQMLWRTEDIFSKMGFEIMYPYEIDDDYHNFGSLNLPEGHPARDSWDTFWTEDGQIAITHTSSMQNRVLQSKNPPIRVVVPGKCFRNEATDARHEHTFHQVEGVFVDKGISINHMLGTLQMFFSEFFERKVEVKFTPDFFPFVEPGGMMSLTCILCEGKGCAVCKQTGWLEVLGCGMIHPKVLEMGGVDSNVYSGFAWGFGLERLVMLKFNIEDVRYFNSGKLDFLRQF